MEISQFMLSSKRIKMFLAQYLQGWQQRVRVNKYD